MVRRRVEIKPIPDKSKRHTTFTKRRKGMFKKTDQLCQMCDVQAAAIAVSKHGNAFVYGNPSVDQVLSRYFADPAFILATKEANKNDVNERVHGGGGSGTEADPPPPSPLTDMEKRIGEAMRNGRPAWEATVRNLGLSEIDELEAAVVEFKSKVAERVREQAASGGRKNVVA